MTVFFHENHLMELSAQETGTLIAGCICDSAALISMCIAFQVASTSVVSMIGYLGIVYAILTDIFVFGESLGIAGLIGCCAVILILLSVSFYKARLSAESPQENMSSPTCQTKFMQMNFKSPCITGRI